MWSYLRNQRSKQTNLVDLQFLSNYVLFSKKLVQNVVKKGSLNMKEYYIIPLNEFQNETILFSRKLSL